MAMEERGPDVRVDGMVHATFWVAEWPRDLKCGATSWHPSSSARPGRLSLSSWSRSVPTQPCGRSRRRGRRTWPTASCAGAAASSRPHATPGGSEVLARREAELAEGHASFRYSGYVTAPPPSEEELVAACDVVQHAAGQSRLALRRLYGDQASAYTCTLPLCRWPALRGPRRAPVP